MPKPISPLLHGVLDYSTVALTALAPTLFGFGPTGTAVAYALAVGYLVVSLLTRYPLGVVKAIPLTVHTTIEVVLAVLLVALPWLLGFADDTAARNYLFFLVALTFVVVPLTRTEGDVAVRAG